MKISYDPAKNAWTIAERRLSFELVRDMDWETAVAREDRRRDYGERRLPVLGMIESRLHAVVVTYRDDTAHVISLRKANKKQVRRYEDEH